MCFIGNFFTGTHCKLRIIYTSFYCSILIIRSFSHF
nr:MAG TPA: hypothetical protein [Caudoviricetes sp.]